MRFLHALCYVSDDPHLYVNDHAVPYVVPPPAPSPPPPPRHLDTPPDYARVARPWPAFPITMPTTTPGSCWAWRSTVPGKPGRGTSGTAGVSRARSMTRASKPNPGGASPDGRVTIASLFHLAKQHGYVPPRQATPHAIARNGHGVSASHAAQQDGHAGHSQAATPQTGQAARDPVDAARQAADSCCCSWPPSPRRPGRMPSWMPSPCWPLWT